MIDGIKIKTELNDLDLWTEITGIKLVNRIYKDSGEIERKKRGEDFITTLNGKWETYKIEVKEIKNQLTGLVKFYLTVRGSFHKNHFRGKNYQPFHIEDLFYQINHLCKSLHINANQVRISNIEIGVNIQTNFNVEHFLKNRIINYKGRAFNSYSADKNGLELGLYCIMRQYQFKLYDKGMQYQLSENIMRAEIKFKKMQILNKKGIEYLSDLLNKDNVYRLKSILTDCWQQTLISEIDCIDSITSIIDSDKNLLAKGLDPKFWGYELKKNRDHHNYLRKKFRKLNLKHGQNVQSEIMSLLSKGWDSLFQDSTFLPSGDSYRFHRFTHMLNSNNVEYLTY